MSVDDVYTKSLLHFEGDDGSGSFIDESKKPWYPYVVQIDDAQKKFGKTSGVFAAGVIKTPNHTDWYLGSTDFTIDFLVKSTQTTQYATLISNSPGTWGTGMWSLLTSASLAGDLSFYCYNYNSGTPMLQTAGSLFNTGNWVHVALVRYGNDWTIYVDGVSKATRNTATTVQDINNVICIGGDNTYNRYYVGWMDEFRYSKIARWTGAFTPPANAYHASATYLHARRDRMNMMGISTQNSRS